MHVRTVVPVSERRACRGLAQPRSTQRRPARVAADEPAWIARLITRARRFGRSGSRRSTALLRAEGWRVTHKRVERLWRPRPQKERARPCQDLSPKMLEGFHQRGDHRLSKTQCILTRAAHRDRDQHIAAARANAITGAAGRQGPRWGTRSGLTSGPNRAAMDRLPDTPPGPRPRRDLLRPLQHRGQGVPHRPGLPGDADTPRLLPRRRREHPWTRTESAPTT